MLYDVPLSDRYYLVYLRDDAAQEPISIGYSIPGTIADAAKKTGRDRKDFVAEEITEEQYEALRQFL